MTRVVVIPADTSACGFYRMKTPAGAVQQVRPDWTIEVYDPNTVQLGGDHLGNLWGINGIPDPRSIDLLVMQRVGVPLQANLLRWARDTGIATVMDMDDAMWCIHPENPAHSVWNGDRTHWRIADSAAEVVDLVTVTTPALAKRYSRKHGRVEVLPNTVPADVPEIVDSIRGQFDPTVTIGWAGLTDTHPHDLEVVGDAVRRVVAETGCKVRVIGDAEGAMRDWGLTDIDQIGPVPLGVPYYTALTSIDVALVPLQDTPFNRAKSYLKALEFSSVGVPVIASDTPAHRDLQMTVPIAIAKTPQGWYENLMRLTAHPCARTDVTAEGWQAVRAHHTTEGNAEKWAQAWERAMARRSRLS